MNFVCRWFTAWRLGYSEEARTGRFELWWSAPPGRRGNLVPCSQAIFNRLAGTKPLYTAVLRVLASDEISAGELRQRVNEYAGVRCSLTGFYWLMCHMEDDGLVACRDVQWPGLPGVMQRRYRLTKPTEKGSSCSVTPSP